MECYERGLLTKADCDGLELTWGNGEAMEALWHKVAKREGIGALLAQGVRAVARQVGRGSESFAMHAKGLEFAGYTPNAHPDRALQYAVGDRGGCHHYGLTIGEQNSRMWADSLASLRLAPGHAGPGRLPGHCSRPPRAGTIRPRSGNRSRCACC